VSCHDILAETLDGQKLPRQHLLISKAFHHGNCSSPAPEAAANISSFTPSALQTRMWRKAVMGTVSRGHLPHAYIAAGVDMGAIRHTEVHHPGHRDRAAFCTASPRGSRTEVYRHDFPFRPLRISVRWAPSRRRSAARSNAPATGQRWRVLTAVRQKFDGVHNVAHRTAGPCRLPTLFFHCHSRN
jgi:hypothetical protein